MNLSYFNLIIAIFAYLNVAQANEGLLSNLLGGSEKDFELLSAAVPSAEPTAEPTAGAPTLQPSRKPSASPTLFMPTPVPGDPTNSPTPQPTFIPTAGPTYKTSPILRFTSALTLGGAKSMDLNAIEQLAVRNVTAWAMEVTLNTVTFVGSTSTAENRRKLRKGMSLFTTSWEIVATTRLDLPVSAADTTNTTLLYNQKTSLLNNAVANNILSTQLQKVATQLGAESLVDADVDSVDNSAATVDDDLQYPPSDNEDKLSDGAIAGIVIGAVVFLFLVVAGIYYFIYVGKSEPQSHKVYVQSNNDEENA